MAAQLGKPIWKMSDDDVPSQEEMTRRLADARSKTMAWIDSIGEEGLAKPWHDENALNGLERVTYALRHLQHHTGEVCAYQKQQGIEAAPWR